MESGTPEEGAQVTAASSAFDRELQSLSDTERRALAASSRLQRADRRIADGLSGTFLGTLLELKETGGPVTILTRTNDSIRGTITESGANGVVIRTNRSGLDVLLRTDSIEGLLEAGNGHDRRASTVPNGPTFAELLDRYSEEFDRIAVTTTSGNKLMGHIKRIGEDQLLLELDGQGDTMTIPIAAIDQVVTAR